MKRLILAAAFAALAQPAFAEDAEPTHYVMTLQKVELCTAGSLIDFSGNSPPVCADPYVIGTGNKSFDIAAAGKGEPVGSYASFHAQTWPVGKTFTFMRATLSRRKQITAKVNFPAGFGPASGSCVTGAGDGTATALAMGADSATGASLATVWEKDLGGMFGDSLSDLWGGGKTYLGTDSYTQMIPLNAPYIATATLPTMTVVFDMATGAQAAWMFHQNCDGTSSGTSHCCMDMGQVNAHISLE